MRLSELPCKRHRIGLSYCLARLLTAAAPAFTPVLWPGLSCGDLVVLLPRAPMFRLLAARAINTQRLDQGCGQKQRRSGNVAERL